MTGVPAPTAYVHDIVYDRVPVGAEVTVYGVINNLSFRETKQGNLWVVFDLQGVGRKVCAHMLPSAYEAYRNLLDPRRGDGTMRLPLVAATGVVNEEDPPRFNVYALESLPYPDGFRYGDDPAPVIAELLKPYADLLGCARVPSGTFDGVAEIHNDWKHEGCDTYYGGECPGDTSKMAALEVFEVLHAVREHLTEEVKTDPTSDSEAALRWVRAALATAPDITPEGT